jgi:hypothetical protein
MSDQELVLDNLTAAPTKCTNPSPRRERAFEFIGREVTSGRPFPSLKQIKDFAFNKGGSPTDVMVALRRQGMVARYFPGGDFSLPAVWRLTPLGLERWRSVYEPSETKTRTKAPKPRRPGSPKRVPHKPTAAHKKPTRQQRRETERRREHPDRVTL